MLTAIVILLGLIAVLLLVLLVEVVIWRSLAGRQPSAGAVPPPSAPPTSAGKAIYPGPPDGEGNREASRKDEEYEKRWRDGMDAMMSYDLQAAINAVRGDRGETG